jgi:tetratricopeptide (TPR) repeat protein
MRSGFLVFVLFFTLFYHHTSAQKTLRLINRGKYEKAEVLSNKLLEEFKAYDRVTAKSDYTLRKIAKKISAYHALGLLHRLKGDLAAAELNYKKADSAYLVLKSELTRKGSADFLDGIIKNTSIGEKLKSRHDRRHYARRNDVASINIRLGELATAKSILDSTFRAMKIAYGEKASMARTSYATYGEYFMEQGMYDSSRFYYEKLVLSLRSDPNYYDLSLKKISDAYSGLAQAHLGMKNTEQAIEIAKKAHKFAHHRFVKATDGKNYPGKISTANLLAEAYRVNGNYDQAIKWNNKAFNLFNSRIRLVTPEKLPVLATRGQIFWTQQDTASANACFREMMEIFFNYTQNNFSYLSETERAYFFRKNKYFLEMAKGYYHYLYFNKNYQQEYILKRLYEIHLNNKGVLLSSSSKLLNVIYSKGDPSLIDQYQQIKNLKERKNKSLETGNTDLVLSLENDITQKEKNLRNILAIDVEKYVKTEDVLKTLPDSTHLVDIMKCRVFDVATTGGKNVLTETDENSYLYFILSKGREPLLIRNNLTAKELETRYYHAYLNVSRNDLRDERVHKAYFEPLQKYLAFKNLIISPDGIYNLVNPEIIYDGKKFLINDYNFQSVVSAKDLQRKDSGKAVLKDITLIGWPDYSTHLTRYEKRPVELPGTAREISEIKKVLDQSMMHNTYLREQANELVVKDLPSSSILHFATHGFFQTAEAKDPMYTSGLVLAITDSIQNNEDGFLTAYEASNLDLKNTFLVVLSACETGQGAFEEGEGVWGLQRAFQVAGVRYIIMSLFKVDDDVTSLLMQQFYKNMVRGDHVLLAFRKAQMSVKANYPKPVEWGAFVIKGY